MIREGRNQLAEAAIGCRQIIPAAIGQNGQNGRDQQDRAARHPPLGHRGRKYQIGVPFDPGSFFAKAAHHLAGIQPEKIGIGAHKADAIDGAGQFVEPAMLDRVQQHGPNTQDIGDISQLVARLLARLPQDGAEISGATIAPARSPRLAVRRALLRVCPVCDQAQL